VLSEKQSISCTCIRWGHGEKECMNRDRKKTRSRITGLPHFTIELVIFLLESVELKTEVR
jgi:hypothetical protein